MDGRVYPGPVTFQVSPQRKSTSLPIPGPVSQSWFRGHPHCLNSAPSSGWQISLHHSAGADTMEPKVKWSGSRPEANRRPKLPPPLHPMSGHCVCESPQATHLELWLGKLLQYFHSQVGTGPATPQPWVQTFK